VGSEIEELKDSIKESKKEGGDIIERRKMRQDLNRLEQERLLIIENTTEAEREQAKAISELSEAQKILSSAEEQKKVLEERKKLYEAIQEGEKINLEEIQDYENLKLAEGLVAKQEALNTELETVQANYDAQREAIMKLTEEKKNFEKEWTDFFGTEIQKQKGYADDLITKLRRIIALQKEAGIEASGFSSGRVSSSSGSNSVTTNNNQRRVDVNITANNNVDIDYAVEKISEKIQ
jgi:chromosome segregation ATPase